MDQLSTQHCEICDASATLLTASEIELLLPQLDGWAIVEDSGVQTLQRTFTTRNYSKSMAFTNAVATLAESVDHHPQMIVEYGSVTVSWWTHTVKGLHKNDFILAARTTELF